MKQNQEDLRELCKEILEFMDILQDEISMHGKAAAPKFKVLCEDFEK